MNRIEEIRSGIENCRNELNWGCQFLTSYRDRANIEGASHPLLFQAVQSAKIMIIGAVPGSLDADESKAAYQKLVNGQFSLGHKSAQGLGEVLFRLAKIKGISLPRLITHIPTTSKIQDVHLAVRKQLGLHVTNLVKCNAPSSWETKDPERWKLAADSCQERHLAEETRVQDPSMIILLGKEVASYFSKRERWRMDTVPITRWSAQAGPKPFYGKSRYVTAWCHPGGRYFWIQGKRFWQEYAEQLAPHVLTG